MTAGHHLPSRSILTPANLVTMLRIVLAPLVVLALYFYAPAWWVWLFGFASMATDKVDGYLARRYGVTHLGIFLDPLADKVMVLGALGVLVIKGWVWWLPAALIAAREIAMSMWRTRLARRGVSVPARKLAKYKTLIQSFTISLAVVPGLVDHHKWILTTAMWISVALTWFTFAQYMSDGRYKSAKSTAEPA